MDMRTAARRLALVAIGVPLGGLGCHLYRRKRREPTAYNPHTDPLPRDTQAWTPYHHRWDARQQLRADLVTELRDGVNAALTRLTLGLYQPEPLEYISGRTASDADTSPRDGNAPTPLRVAQAVRHDD